MFSRTRVEVFPDKIHESEPALKSGQDQLNMLIQVYVPEVPGEFLYSLKQQLVHLVFPIPELPPAALFWLLCLQDVPVLRFHIPDDTGLRRVNAAVATP